GHVEEPLDDLRPGRLHEPIREDEPAGPHRGDEDLPRRLLVEGRPILDPDTAQAALEERLGRKATSAVHLGDDHDVRTGLLDEGAQVLDLPEERLPGGTISAAPGASSRNPMMRNGGELIGCRSAMRRPT